jgi:hypothetical protein
MFPVAVTMQKTISVIDDCLLGWDVKVTYVIISIVDMGTRKTMRLKNTDVFLNLILYWYYRFIEALWKHSWLRHYATSWKVMGSIPDEVTGCF